MSSTLTSTDPALTAFAREIGEQGPVGVVGARTAWDIGGRPAPETRFLSAPAGIVEHVPAEMTVTVRAGTTVSQLHDALAAKGQRTALPERGGTVGGAIAVGHNDHRSLGRGTVSQSVLQVRYVSAEGRLVTGGGPTVKNVTGFDLPRLMTGSLGTLGCLAEFIIRTNPIPPVSRWLVSTDADPFAAFKSVLAPSAVMWDGATTWVQLEGHAADVKAQTAALATSGRFSETDQPPSAAGHRWSLTPRDLRSLDNHATGDFLALIGLGIVFAEQPQPERPLHAATAEVAARVKAEYDPSGRLNPGRYPGGS